MNYFDDLIEDRKHRIEAALSPSQMTKQYSKSTNITDDLAGMFTMSYRKDGLTYEDYDQMLMDPQIKSGFELIRMFLLSRKLQVIPASDDQADVDIACEIEDMFDNMSYPMRKIRNDMYTAIIYGYSVGEVIWKPDENSSHIHIDRIRPIPIDTLKDCFEYDDNGDLVNILQEDPEGGDPIEIPAEKCLVYTYDEKFGDRSGTSILDACYDNWFQKQKLLKWWNIFLQKHEGPTLIGKVENPAYKDLFREQLDDIREGRTNMTIGMNDNVEVLESNKDGKGFKDAIDYHDTMIFRKMNIGTMILGQESGKGAYAQSQTQNDVLNIFLDGIHEDIATELQAKIKELIDMNYQVDNYPTVSFETFEDKDLVGLINAIEPLIKDMAIDPNDTWFKQLLADIIGQYSDVDMSDYVSKDDEEQDQQKVTPTPEEQNGPKQMSDINDIFNIPGRAPEAQVTPAPITSIPNKQE